VRNLIWRPSALDQLDSLVGYIAERNLIAAERMESLIHHAAAVIESAPMAGRPGRVAGTREWVVHPNYILIYRVTRTRITILRVLHARQRFP
jgi:toxin ParE1/3/4